MCNSPVLSVSSSGLLVVAAVSLPSPDVSAEPAPASVFSTSSCLVFYGKRGGEEEEEEEEGGRGVCVKIGHGWQDTRVHPR